MTLSSELNRLFVYRQWNILKGQPYFLDVLIWDECFICLLQILPSNTNQIIMLDTFFLLDWKIFL